MKAGSAADKFAEAIVDPSRYTSRYPGNNVPTSLSRLPFTVQSGDDEAEAFTESGDVALYLTGVAQEPAFISRRKAVTWAAQHTPAMRAEQVFDSESAGVIPFLAPLFFGDKKSALFSESISSAAGIQRPGWRATVTSAAMTYTVAHNAGFIGSINHWYRDANGDFQDGIAIIQVNSTSSQIQVPANATAFGLSLASLVGLSATVTVGHNGLGQHGMTLGNHTGNCIAVAPDYDQMRIKRGRTIGISAWLRYDGSEINNGGAAVGVQFSPGTYPTEFPGKSLADQITSCGLPGRYAGHFRDGMHAKYVHNSPANYLMAPTRSQSGILCLTWSGVPGAPQPWTVFFNQVLEYTTSIVAFEKQIPEFALPNELAVVIADLNRMQLITSNDSHDYVMKLWRSIRNKALAVARNPRTWHTIAEVGAAAAALL